MKGQTSAIPSGPEFLVDVPGTLRMGKLSLYLVMIAVTMIVNAELDEKSEPSGGSVPIVHLEIPHSLSCLSWLRSCHRAATFLKIVQVGGATSMA